MRIDRLELYQVAMPLIYPWRTAYGEDADVHSILLKVTSGDVYAWAETTPLVAPCYSPETTAGAFFVINDWLAPALVGRSFDTAGELLGAIAHFKGNAFAKAGMEIAWWQLEAKRQGVPLRRLLGGGDGPVAVGADFGVQDSIDMLLEKVQGALDAGYPRVKLKFSRTWGLDVVRAARRTFPDATFHIDCNSGFTLDDVDLFRQVDTLGLAMIEQPLVYNDIVDHAELQRQLRTPICLDESIKDVHTMRKAIQLGSCRYVNIKAGRVGGLTVALEIHDLCRDAGIPCWVGGMLESALGNGISTELATLPNFTYPADIFPRGVHYADDLSRPEVELCAPGQVMPSTVPGTPHEPDPGRLQARTVRRVVLEA